MKTFDAVLKALDGVPIDRPVSFTVPPMNEGVAPSKERLRAKFLTKTIRRRGVVYTRRALMVVEDVSTKVGGVTNVH